MGDRASITPRILLLLFPLKAVDVICANRASKKRHEIL